MYYYNLPLTRTRTPMPSVKEPKKESNCRILCYQCRFYDNKCRRNAPLTIKNNLNSQAIWPIVQPNDWCGQAEPR